MKRRTFLRHTGTAVSIPLLLNGLKLSASPRQAMFRHLNPDNDKVIVLIQLIGGNDGLNCIVPMDQYDNLANARGNILLPENELLYVTDTNFFHPAMLGMKSLYDDAKMRIVQSVGYPNQNRSHFRSLDIWNTGSPAEEAWRTGWFGRYFESLHPSFPTNYPNEEYPHPFAITMASIVSETCQGTASNFSMTLEDPFSLSPLTEGNGSVPPDTPYGEELEFLRISISQTNDYAAMITEAANLGNNIQAYPTDNNLAEYLKTIALLLSGGLQTKVFIVPLGGFDTHANQVEEGKPADGEHAGLLSELSDAVNAFHKDLQALGLGERVVTMTFSEFGRQIKSNESFGTDHGTAAPLMLFGQCVVPGFLGNNPEIPNQVADQEGLAMQYDFRDVYGSVLMDWFEVPEDDVRNLFYQDFQYLPVLQPCSTVNAEKLRLQAEDLQLHVFPSPFQHGAQIRFYSEGAWVKLSLFNSLGSEVRVLTNRRLPVGQHDLRLEGHGLAPGNYYLRLQMDSRQKVVGVVKI
ncbi:MAG TPA: DUF1501 domain-containing protein [Saprospiraceae bacterium]|nr:DUF1501 domain-containing protein [Saprospiraceae bacterium]HMQ85079.1 DUF1501 domain-containing protein [Saprospiraceae bacterium]